MENLTLEKPKDVYRNVTEIISNSTLAPSTKGQYIRSIDRYIESGGDLTDMGNLYSYASKLQSSSRSFFKAAIKQWANYVSNQLKTTVTPENSAYVQAILYRLEAIDNSIKLKKPKGTKVHNWLSKDEVKLLLSLVESPKLIVRRDRLILALLVAAGLRRKEVVCLTFDDVDSVHIRERKRTYLNIIGKGDKSRTVPVNDSLAELINEWHKILEGKGFVVRGIGNDETPKEDFTGDGLFSRVRKYGVLMGKPTLAPHDLRRTYAQISFESGVDISQLSELLGHSNIATTQRYLNININFETSGSDFVPL